LNIGSAHLKQTKGYKEVYEYEENMENSSQIKEYVCSWNQWMPQYVIDIKQLSSNKPKSNFNIMKLLNNIPEKEKPKCLINSLTRNNQTLLEPETSQKLKGKEIKGQSVGRKAKKLSKKKRKKMELENQN